MRLYNLLQQAFSKLGLISDYVVETKIDGVWKYEKWASGKVEVWTVGKQTYTGAIASGSSSLGYDFSLILSMPISLMTVEVVAGQAAPKNGNWGVVSGWTHSGNTTSLTVYSSGHYSDTTVLYSIRVLGTWK